MKVEILSLPDYELKDYDYLDVVEVRIDGKTVWSVFDDEPNGAKLSDSFKDCYRVDVLMKLAYQAGLKKEKLEITKRKVPGDELWKEIEWNLV